MGYAARRFAFYALCLSLLCGPACYGQGQAVAESEDKTLRSGTGEMSVRPPPASYDEFLTRARALHPGMTRAAIVVALRVGRQPECRVAIRRQDHGGWRHVIAVCGIRFREVLAA